MLAVQAEVIDVVLEAEDRRAAQHLARLRIAEAAVVLVPVVAVLVVVELGRDFAGLAANGVEGLHLIGGLEAGRQQPGDFVAIVVEELLDAQNHRRHLRSILVRRDDLRGAGTAMHGLFVAGSPGHHAIRADVLGLARRPSVLDHLAVLAAIGDEDIGDGLDVILVRRGNPVHRIRIVGLQVGVVLQAVRSHDSSARYSSRHRE